MCFFELIKLHYNYMQHFQNLGIEDSILRAISELGFETPTPIQEKTIPHIITSTQDVIALAQTGTGKTAAFGLPIINNIDTALPETQALILCPTRELCIQITNDLKKYSKYIVGLKVVPVYGGASIDTQIRDLRHHAQIVVGTPGRVIDLIHRKKLNFSFIKWLVLDESDEMLNMGFKEDIDTILETTPASRQTLLFSATMPAEVQAIAQNYMKNPLTIVTAKRNAGADNIAHQFYLVRNEDRYLALKRLADFYPNIYGIVFCKTRTETKDIADKLIEDGYNADALHGDLTQAQRDNVMGRFRTGTLQILVATDVAARGLDVNDITHVINYNLPGDSEVYVHRSGRTGRAGKSGVAISLISSKDLMKLRQIEKFINKKFEQKQIPTGQQICENQIMSLVDVVKNIEVNHSQIESFLPGIYEKFETFTREDLIKHFISVEFNRFLTYYKNSKDLNVNAKDRDKSERKGDGERDRDRDRGRGTGSRDERSGRSDGGFRDRKKDYKRDDSDKRSTGTRTANGDSGWKKDNKDRSDSKGKGKNKIEFQKLFINLGSKDKITKGNIIELIIKQKGLSTVEIGRIEVFRDQTSFEIDRSYLNPAIKALRKSNYKGNPLIVDVME